MTDSPFQTYQLGDGEEEPVIIESMEDKLEKMRALGWSADVIVNFEEGRVVMKSFRHKGKYSYGDTPTRKGGNSGRS